MNKITKGLILICICAMASASFAYAAPLQYLNIKLPSYFSSVSSISILSDSLKSKNEFVRKCAVVRLVELGNTESVSMIIEAYENEPIREFTIDLNNGLRYYSLSGLGKLKSPEAAAYLRKLAQDVFILKADMDWAKGDAFQIVVGVLDGLAEIGTEEDTNFLLSVFDGAEFGSGIRKFAFTAYTRVHLRNPELINNREKVAYVLEYLKSLVDSDPMDTLSTDTPDQIKRRALFTNLVELGIESEDQIMEYKLNLPVKDPFVKELENVLSIVRNWKSYLNNVEK